jgi:hypothetical protein
MMMNGNGLAALTAPRPPQGMGQPTPAPQQRMPQPRMPQPRPQPPMNQGIAQLMGGPKPSVREQMAIEVVNDDIEPLDLDPKLEAALKLQEAKELVQSANQVLAPNPANMVQQLQQQVPAGIASLSAQMQGRPQMGMQRPPAPRPPMAGGLPQLPSNLPRAAQGGIVAFKDGGFPDLSGDGKVTRKDILMGRGVVSKAEGGLLSEVDSYMSAQAVLNNPDSTDQQKAFAKATLDSLKPIEEGGNMTMDQYAAMMQEVSRRQQGGMAGGGIVGFNQGLMVRSQERARAREDEEEERNRIARRNEYERLKDTGMSDTEIFVALQNFSPTSRTPTSGVLQLEDVFDVATMAKQLRPSPEYDPSGEETKGLPFGMAQDTDTTTAPPVVDSDRTSELLEQITDVITTPTGDEVIESATATSLGDFAQERLDRDGEELERERMERARDYYQLSDREKELMMQNRDAIKASYDSRLAPEEVRRLENESLMRILLEPGSVVNAARAKQIEGPAFRERMRQLQEGRVTEPNKVELEMLAQERGALGKVWEAGTKAYERFSAETNQAMQTLAQLETGALNRQTQFLIADRSNQIRALDAQLRAELARVKETNLTEAQERTHRANMARTLSSLFTTTQSTITDLQTQAQLGQIPPDLLADSINNLQRTAANYAEALQDYGDTGEVPELDFGSNVLGGEIPPPPGSFVPDQ